MTMTDNLNDMVIAPSDWVVSDEIIKVLGVGGGGSNAVNYMFNQKIEGCSFAVCNTDSQALRLSPVPVKLQLGSRGLGAGCNPIKGRNAAIESQDEIEKAILGPATQMLFITAGLGGGTGTGATPVIAKMAKDKGILTVAVVTIPFRNEGDRAMSRAIDGIHELEKNVDSLLIIDNDKLSELYGNSLIHDAFPKADEILATAVKGVIEIIQKPGYINVDFEDVKTMMKDSGMALMGHGVGTGKDRIETAVKQAFESPLLNDFDLKSARNVLVNITGGHNDEGLKMDDLTEINRKIDEYTGGANNFKRGLIWDDDPSIGDAVHITSIVTGLRFTDIFGANKQLGDYIPISTDYVYNRDEAAQGDGITLPEGSSSNIGFSSTENVRTFHFEEDCRPTLLVDEGDDLSDLEEIPSIRRQRKSNEKT